MPSKCAVSSCPNSSRYAGSISYYSLPKNIETAIKWVEVCKRDLPLSSNFRVCSEHFDAGDYERNLQAELLGYVPRRLKLKEGAVPHLKLREENTSHTKSEKPKENPRPIPSMLVDHNYTHKIGNNLSTSNKTCCVPYCFGRPTENIFVHRFPKNPLYLEKWMSAFKMISVPKNAFACDRHFEKSPHNYTVPTKRKRLKMTAIPTLNLPRFSYIQNDSHSKKSVLDGAKKKIKSILQSLDNDEMANESIAEEIADKILMNAIKSGTKPVDAHTIKRIITNGKLNGSHGSKKRIYKTSKRRRSSKKNLESPQIHLGPDWDEGDPTVIYVKCEPWDIYDADEVVIKEEPVPDTFLDPLFADNINDTEVTIKEEPLFDWEDPTRPTDEVVIKEEPVPDIFLDPPFADNINDTEVTIKEEPLFDWEEPTRTKEWPRTIKSCKALRT